MKRRMRWRGPKGDYHTFNRGARRLRIFADDGDRRYFVRLLALTARKHGVWVLAWCLMDNHYHLSLRTDGERMGKMVRDLEKTYARYFNKRTGHVGALFEGRFGSVWLPDMEAVAYVSRYIHANCRDKGVDPRSYPWSSCRAYLQGAEASDWFDPGPVLRWAGGPDGYRRYLAEVPPLSPKQDEADGPQAALIGHIQDRLRRVFPKGAKHFSLRLLTCWAAVRLFALRPKVLAQVLGYASGRTVSAGIARLTRELGGYPDILNALTQVLTK